MRGRLRYKILVSFLSLVFFAAACSGAFYLSKLYVGILTKGFVPQAVKVNTDNSKSVVAGEDQETLMLNPVPVFFLQAGVFSDQQGAQTGMKPLTELGYKPYITQSPPHKLWIGIFASRAGTEPIKAKLLDKGIGSFTGSVVVNGSNLRYAKTNEALIKEVSPVLDLYTQWLKENLQIFGGGDVAELDQTLLEKQLTVAGKVYNDISRQQPLKFNNEDIHNSFNSLRKNVDEYWSQLQVFGKEKKQEQYQALQWKLLEFVDNYMVIIQKIENISKT